MRLIIYACYDTLCQLLETLTTLHPAQGYPHSGLAAAATTAFHAGVAAVLGLYALFWLRLRLTDTLPVLAALVTVTGAAGYVALTARAAARRKLA